ncbi:hypothetical protein L9F63_009829, partial [Diploptera punctata]
MYRDIYSAINPLYYFSKILGLAPFNIIKGNKIIGTTNKITVTKYGQLYTITIIFIAIFFTTSAIAWRAEFQYRNDTKSSVIGNLFFWISSLCSTVFGLLLPGIIYSKKLINIIKTINEFDAEFLLNQNANYKKASNFIKLEIIIFCTTYGSLCLYHIWVYQSSDTLNQHFGINYVLYLINFAVIIQIGNLVYYIQQRLAILNKRITNYNETSKCNSNILQSNRFFNVRFKNSKIYQSNKECNTCRNIRLAENGENMSNIRTLRKHQSSLRDLTDLVNEVYGFQILLEFIAAFIDTTGNLYCLLQCFNSKEVKVVGGGHFYVMKIGWTIAIMLKVLFVTVLCHKTSEEGSKTVSHLQRLLLSLPTDAASTMEIHLFSQQVISRPFRFTAFGLFDVDRSALCSFFGAIITYLIVLLQ